jgi:hypothetical protein
MRDHGAGMVHAAVEGMSLGMPVMRHG